MTKADALIEAVRALEEVAGYRFAIGLEAIAVAVRERASPDSPDADDAALGEAVHAAYAALGWGYSPDLGVDALIHATHDLTKRAWVLREVAVCIRTAARTLPRLEVKGESFPPGSLFAVVAQLAALLEKEGVS